MIDIDKSRITTERAFGLAVSETLKNIELELNSKHTVIWSGDGSHIVQSKTARALEDLDLFSRIARGNILLICVISRNWGRLKQLLVVINGMNLSLQ
jgi:hypothetical protein